MNPSHNGLKVCVGNHATSDKCEWDYYVREEKLTELQSANTNLAAECEGLRERFERAKKLLLGYRGWFVQSGRIDINQQSEIAEIDAALSAAGGRE